MKIQSGKAVRFATDPAYVGGTYNGQPNKVEPSSGLRAQGFVPGTFLPFPRLNYLLDALGSLSDGLADICSVNWSVPVTTDDTAVAGKLADGLDYHYTSFSQHVDLLNPDYLVALGFSSGANATVLLSRDAYVWEAGTASGLTGTVGGPVTGLENAGPLAIILWDDTTKAVRKTLDAGTWADAGDLHASWTYPASNPGLGAYLQAQDRWVIFGALTINTHDTLADTAWTVRTPPVGWSGGDPICIASGTAGILCGLSTSGTAVFTADGITYDFIDTGVGVQMISCAYSESHAIWVALFNDGSVWKAPPDASTWTELATHTASAANVIKCLGRSIVVAGESISVSGDAGVSWRMVGYISPTGSSNAWDTLTPFGGSLVVGHFVSGTVDLVYSRSLVAPFALGL